MGQTAEVVGHLFGITRAQSDAYAVESHKRLADAQAQGWLKGEVETAFARDGKFYEHDDGVRPDSSPESLAKLKPVFERPWGQVTAGNSSQITDGASWTILASEEAVAKHGLAPKAVIVDSQWSALDPSIMGLGPVLSATELLKRNKLSLGDIETWELNEAFATQVLGCLAPGTTTNSAARFWVSRGPPGKSITQDSMSMAAPSALVIPWAAAAIASCCISSTR